MMVATAVVLVVLSGALTTFKNALAINDSASQLADANQNLRAGTNQLIRDMLMAGRIIGTEGHCDADRRRHQLSRVPGPPGDAQLRPDRRRRRDPADAGDHDRLPSRPDRSTDSHCLRPT